MTQLELFARDPDEELFPYWRKQLADLPGEVWHWRHHIHTTAWSCACGDWLFAAHLFRHGQMTRSEFRRWWKFGRRCRRWKREKKHKA